jgi:hypothetical protein
LLVFGFSPERSRKPTAFWGSFLKIGASDQRKLRHELIKNTPKSEDLTRSAGGFLLLKAQKYNILNLTKR